MPKISFVMPEKNRGDRIGKTIQTIIDQTEKDFELIIVDDHSDPSDKTEEIVKTFNDKRIRFIHMPEDLPKGIATARNFGNQFAESSIIAVADSDDLFKPKRAELTIKAFKKTNCDVFFAKNDIYDEVKKEFIPPMEDFHSFNVSMLKKRNYIAHSSSAYKRHLAYEFPYNSFFKKAEDYDLFTRLAVAGKKFYFCDEIVYTYIIHNENISRGLRLVNYNDLIHLNRGWIKKDRNIVIKGAFGENK
ncbi:MAG: glycosyltransferase [Candidatus Berkelbacteria bacterium Athens1014_28]|uniref:Glycosyltransferase n=1 Tax=Candidatus Berkelbacteria bacterium Athens1014_28 TaxID=2017145 RepID=A0A554LLE9_9BACT|nr:MAG: glycosyltransferase [Candidatus Berkelbacteria bacterium Athens1014_28]